MPERLRILTWHVHGNYLYYLSQVPHDFYLVRDELRSTHRSGRSGSLPWGDNVHEAPVEHLRNMQFDVVLYQSRLEWESDREQLLAPTQRALPRIYVEHDPPLQSPTGTLHWVQDPGALLVHVTPFNALMWDAGVTPTRVVEHGVKPLSDARYEGRLERGITVVNNMQLRGRRLGLDIYHDMARTVPLDLVGMGSKPLGGLGEIDNAALPGAMAPYRFFFNPIRYTSLGLAIVEAMMVGLPIVGLATTELAAVIRSGQNGYVDTRPERLAEVMHMLLREPGTARDWGEAGRRLANERFHIDRFVADWMDAFASVTR
ncbi:glycosyltransferase [Pseudorhodoferax soli]|uniref:Glycosyl transferase family 1 n=1 Tax=Pseudorhodoferax soli TaxID=545864 RepID=A0A368XCK8_9BURK|nr:glycosyltransferase [Pseudorhodoferax soli]RCW64738.1 glycosyl transferase family 1 [Pseudorhodoferax soli]